VVVVVTSSISTNPKKHEGKNMIGPESEYNNKKLNVTSIAV